VKGTRVGQRYQLTHGDPNRRKMSVRCRRCGNRARYDCDRRGNATVVCENETCGHVARVKRQRVAA